MSPEAQQKVKRATPAVASSLGIVAVVTLLGQYGVLEALASNLRSKAPDAMAIEQAVSLADGHARDLITREIAPVRAELRELTRQVDRMAGALEESNRRRSP